MSETVSSSETSRTSRHATQRVLAKRISPAACDKTTGSYPRKSPAAMMRTQRKFVYPSIRSPTFQTRPYPSTKCRAYRNEMNASSCMKRFDQANRTRIAIMADASAPSRRLTNAPMLFTADTCVTWYRN